MFTETARRASGWERAGESAFWQYLLPSRCLACGSRPVERAWQGGVCRACWDAIEPMPEPRCRRCDEPLEDESAETCGRCLSSPPPFETLRAAATYRGAARAILLAFKFRSADYLARHLAERIERRLPPPRGAAEVTAVPAKGRVWRRGESAAQSLGRAVAARLGLPFAPGRLEKRRRTERQSALPLARREGNVRGAFRARGRCAETVLLVDDVATSGATARECSRRLKEAGASRVLVWCFARASRLDAPLEPAEPGGPAP